MHDNFVFFFEQSLTDHHCFCRFHVDKLSSAHVYLRLKEGESLDSVPTNIIEEAAQLVKANSIQVSIYSRCFPAVKIFKLYSEVRT
jgi:hypothetical protein